MKTDILIVGSGCSGLYCALHLPRDKQITILSKSDLEKNDSFLAQGGICVLRDEGDYDSFFEDTMRAGHYENDRDSVDIMIRSSREVIADLVNAGVRFTRHADGTFDYTKEGAHSEKRILYHEDVTGKEITEKLLCKVRALPNVTFLPHTALLDITEENGVCTGGVIAAEDGTVSTVTAAYTVLATGGVGGLYRHSTNYRHLTGDGVAIAIRHGIALRDAQYIQIHPTTFYSKDRGDRNFLISESVRGEGAVLYDKHMNRFVDELLPRDLLTEAIRKKMKEDGTDFVWEDLRPIPEDVLREHFPNIVAFCREKGYDVTKECIPVVPAQHYYMGGIRVDHASRASMDGLFAVGETACNGVHGRNRLASNSLLESLVFARRAAAAIAGAPREIPEQRQTDLSPYGDPEAWLEALKQTALAEIRKD